MSKRIKLKTAPIFEIKHPETGTPLLTLDSGEEGPILRIRDYQGNVRIEACADPVEGIAVELRRANGEVAAGLWDLGSDGIGLVVESEGVLDTIQLRKAS